jgi:hypothetical protein
MLLTPVALAQTDSPLPQPADNTNVMPVQVINGPIPPPATALEVMAAKKNVVIVKRYSDVGTVQSDDGSSVRFTAVEFSDAEGKDKVYGLAISIHDVGRVERTAFSYVDYDEIAPLTDALDMLARLDTAANSLTDFEANYRTKGEFELTNVNNNGGRFLEVRSMQILSPSGQIIGARAAFRTARAAEIKQQLLNAKQLLDRIKNAGTEQSK